VPPIGRIWSIASRPDRVRRAKARILVLFNVIFSILPGTGVFSLEPAKNPSAATAIRAIFCGFDRIKMSDDPAAVRFDAEFFNVFFHVNPLIKLILIVQIKSARHTARPCRAMRWNL